MPNLDPAGYSDSSESDDLKAPQLVSSICATRSASSSARSALDHSHFSEESVAKNESNGANQGQDFKVDDDCPEHLQVCRSGPECSSSSGAAADTGTSVVDVLVQEPAESTLMNQKTSARATVDKTVVAYMRKHHTESAGQEKFNWADKYKPRALKDFICHQEAAKALQLMVKNGEIGNIIFGGPVGVGKRTMVNALLREYCGVQTLEGQREVSWKLKGKGGKLSCIGIKISEFTSYIELSASELKQLTSAATPEFLKQISGSQKSDPNKCQAIVMYKAEDLPKNIQIGIQVFLEKHGFQTKIIFCSSSTSKLQYIRHLCTVIQLSPPPTSQIIDVLNFIAKQEDLELPDQLGIKIAKNSDHCVRQAARSFEATWQFKYPFVKDQMILTGWEEELEKIANDILEEQSPKQLYNIRMKLLILTNYNSSSDYIFEKLVGELIKNLNHDNRSRVLSLFQVYRKNEFPCDESSSRRRETFPKHFNESSRRNCHLFMRMEEFIAEFMSFYKSVHEGCKREECL